ncbi:MAG: MopE-related protein [Pseudomonadota bacterium]|nr:MopE-related protein [Pseudomonadota bacterium]
MMRLPLLVLLAACSGPAAKPDDTSDSDTPDTAVGCELLTWYADADGDGFGDASASLEACEPPGRQVLDATDCDDTNAAAFPSAPEDCATGFDANCDGSSGFADADADGTAACEDCDDANPSAWPGAPEFCDGVDNNCDGVADDTPVNGRMYYPDADADGYGDVGGGALACEAPAGWDTTVGDCDDANAAAHPDADELCNGTDDDCDGAIDEEDALDAGTYYDDVDGDGYGHDWTRRRACEEPGGAVTLGGDCEDADPAVSPAAIEVCNGLDDDCSGVIDGDDATDQSPWYRDLDEDGWGATSALLVSCEAPTGYVATDGDCDDGDPDAAPDADETCDGTDDDCDGTVDEDDAIDAPAWYVDADADGYGDPTAFVRACAVPDPEGWSFYGTDCDDAGVASPATAETCNGTDDNCDGIIDEDAAVDAPTWFQDADADGHGDAAASHAACSVPAGYDEDATDCDDADAAVSPDGIEVCNGTDDDCDSELDEDSAVDAPTWYADRDEDGYGEDATAANACAAPVGSVSAHGDCDDTDPAFHPGAAEAECDDPSDYNCDGSVGLADLDGDGWVACEECDDGAADVSPSGAESCNDVDDDCDGVIDNAGAIGSGTWYADTDGDGYGDAAALDRSCEVPAGFVPDATDCEDADAAVSPIGVEVCATAYDDDCDGDAAELLAPDCTTWYLDADGDGFGAASSICGCASDGLYVADNANDCDDASAATNPDATELAGNGIDDDCDGRTDALRLAGADAILAGDGEGDAAGFALAGGADVDGDGFDDLLIGAREDDGADTDAGSAFLVRGPVTGTVLAADADALLLGEALEDFAGFSVSLGDANGDSYADALIGAPGNGAGGRESGAAYLLYGPFSGPLDLAVSDAVLVGDSAGDQAGYAVLLAGDIDGDGVGDLLVSAPEAGDRTSTIGSVYVVLGAPAASVPLGTAEAELFGTTRADSIGAALAAVGDTNGDGFADFLVGAPEVDDAGTSAGAVYLVEGPVSGSSELATTAAARLLGEAASDGAGTAVAGPGDLDRDGYDDLMVGAPSAGVGGRGYVVLSPVTGDFSLAGANAIFESEDASSNLGCAVAAPGDMDGDGTPELVFGADADVLGGTGAGIVYIVAAWTSGTLTSADAASQWFGAEGDQAGGALATAGDTDGDGLRDLFVGAIDADTGATDGGAGYLLLGR